MRMRARLHATDAMISIVTHQQPVSRVERYSRRPSQTRFAHRIAVRCSFPCWLSRLLGGRQIHRANAMVCARGMQQSVAAEGDFARDTSETRHGGDLAIGVAGTALVGGLAGFVRTSGQAPLLLGVAGLWLGAIALSMVGPGPEAIAVAPWRTIAGSLAGAVAGVLALAVRTWWREYR